MTMARPAVFMDRDGTIIEDRAALPGRNRSFSGCIGDGSPGRRAAGQKLITRSAI